MQIVIILLVCLVFVFITEIYIFHNHSRKKNIQRNFEKYPYDIKRSGDIVYFCINLSHREDKFDRMKLEFQTKNNGEFLNFFQAIDHKMIDLILNNEVLHPSYKLFLTQNPKQMGHLGASFSHLSVLQKIIDFDSGITVILEDDVFLVEDFGSHVSNMVKKLSDKDLNWDILYLGYSCSYDDNQLCHLNDKYSIDDGIVEIGYSIGLYGYVVNGSESSKKILNNIYPLKQHIDHQFMILNKNNIINCYGCVPNIVFHPGKQEISSFGITSRHSSRNYISDTNL